MLTSTPYKDDLVLEKKKKNIDGKKSCKPKGKKLKINGAEQSQKLCGKKRKLEAELDSKDTKCLF